jgi:integrase
MARRKNYPGSVDRHGARWRVRFSVRGQRHTFYLEDVTETQAQDWARDEHRKLTRKAKRRSVGLPSSEAMSALLEAFRQDHMPDLAKGTQASYEDSLKPIGVFFVDILGDMAVEDIQASHITQYLTWRRNRNPQGQPRKKPLSNRSLEKDRAVLHLLFNVADMMELREGNPVARTKRPKAKERDPVLLKPAEYERLLKACADDSPMLGLYAVLLGETGARCVSEALWVRWEDVDLEEGFLWLDSSSHGRKTKSDRGRWVPMTRRLRESMREHFARYRFASYASP